MLLMLQGAIFVARNFCWMTAIAPGLILPTDSNSVFQILTGNLLLLKAAKPAKRDVLDQPYGYLVLAPNGASVFVDFIYILNSIVKLWNPLDGLHSVFGF
ncbi:hypothetical protein [Thermoleptolyngbya sp.]